MKGFASPLPRWFAMAACAGLVQACSTAPKTAEGDPATEPAVASAGTAQPGQAPAGGDAAVTPAAPAVAKPKVSTTEWSLLEMSYDEAKAISPQHAEVGDLFRVVGDTVEVVKTDAEGKPAKVRAKGHVFLEMLLPDRATALCDEAVVTPKEALLHGGPMMMQRNRVAKSSTESTSFRITDHLRVSGRFEIINPEDLMQTLMASIDPLPMAPATTAAASVPVPAEAASATASPAAPAKGKKKAEAVR